MIDISNHQLIEAIQFAKGKQTLRKSELQIKFLKGYNWAEAMMLKLEEKGIVSKSKGFKDRDVIADIEECDAVIAQLKILKKLIMDYTEEQINKALDEITVMEHYTMCKIWRFGGKENEIYFRNDYPTGKAFSERLFNHFGGFTPAISKELGWNG